MREKNYCSNILFQKPKYLTLPELPSSDFSYSSCHIWIEETLAGLYCKFQWHNSFPFIMTLIKTNIFYTYHPYSKKKTNQIQKQDARTEPTVLCLILDGKLSYITPYFKILVQKICMSPTLVTQIFWLSGFVIPLIFK